MLRYLTKGVVMNRETLNQFNKRFQGFVEQYDSLSKRQHISNTTSISVAEIHTLVTIAKMQPINLIRLAEKRSVSRSAITQVVKNLERKDLLIKEKVPENSKSIYLKLTASGLEVVREHQKQDDYLNKEVLAILTRYSPSLLEDMIGLMDDIEKVWKNLPWLRR